MKTVFRFVWVIITTISVFASCKTLSFTEKTILAEIPVQYYSKSIVVVDAGEVYTPGLAITKKREEVVTQIKRKYFSNLPDVLRKDLQMTVFTDTSLTDGEKALLLQNDNNVRAKIMEQYKANIVIILQNYEGGFSQDEIQRSRNNDGSVNKQATYSVFFNTNITIIQGDQLYRKRITASTYHLKDKYSADSLHAAPATKPTKKTLLPWPIEMLLMYQDCLEIERGL
ncbi:MAG: hypothetical protein U1C70_07360 [Sediminibacterium sp.]|jgi:hypothetical protein|uniref:hypothetical protein n=1 Tax=Sediminibacterium sp. TaxID=1917865 RepID=UPI002ABB8939|nr:hypothetical protein [Sediminibacterium sp.]MDZ4071625.1 hypothetical protein [Sediminibacterium sp.]